MSAKKAIAAIEKHGILLVYPINNKPEPLSLWSVLHPRSEMRWEWDSGGDDRVADLWRLREELSRSGKVVYAKWFRNRATFFSHDAFTAMVALFGSSREPRAGLSPHAREILGVLDMDSPLSTKQIKLAADLRGKAHERTYEKSMKELWTRLLIVGFGEIEDGAFPSLAAGSTRLLFEDLWNASLEMSEKEAWKILRSAPGQESMFIKHAVKSLQQLRGSSVAGAVDSTDV